MKKIVLVLVAILCIITLLKTENGNSKNRRILTKQALEYFEDKYDADKKNIKIIRNSLTSEYRKQWLYTDTTSDIEIEYNDVECIITYDIDSKQFEDDYMKKLVKHDLLNHLKEICIFVQDNKLVETVDFNIEMPDVNYDTYQGNLVEFFKNSDTEKSGIVFSISIYIYIDNKESSKTVAEESLYPLVKELNQYPAEFHIMYVEKQVDDGIKYTFPTYSKRWFSFSGNRFNLKNRYEEFWTIEEISYDYDERTMNRNTGKLSDFINKKIEVSSFWK